MQITTTPFNQAKLGSNTVVTKTAEPSYYNEWEEEKHQLALLQVSVHQFPLESIPGVACTMCVHTTWCTISVTRAQNPWSVHQGMCACVNGGWSTDPQWSPKNSRTVEKTCHATCASNQFSSVKVIYCMKNFILSHGEKKGKGRVLAKLRSLHEHVHACPFPHLVYLPY